MDEKPRIVAYKLIIDANIVKHRGRTERQNIVHAMEANGRGPWRKGPLPDLQPDHL
jgi:hypothetical protein